MTRKPKADDRGPIMDDAGFFRETTGVCHLLEKYFEKTLTPAERGELAVWLRSDRRNRDLLRRIRGNGGLREYHTRSVMIDPEQEYKLLLKRIPQVRRRRSLWRRYAAAGILAAALLCGWIFIADHRSPAPDIFADSFLNNNKATLYTSDGEVFEIDGSQPVAANDKFAYQDSVRQLVFRADTSVVPHPFLARLEVPRGGEFKLVLPDGTGVWMNSASSIRFPENFAPDKREVYVSGELYFEVTGDTARPFIVHAGEMKTEVLGTCFGISAYADDTQWSIVLAKGRVRVSYHDRSVELSPHRKALLDDGNLHETDANIDRDLAWVKRDFVFESDRLDDVVRRLERWYPVDFRFTDETLRDYRFTGSVSRNMSVDEILGLIEMMNVVTFVHNDGYIDIRPKQ